MRGARGSSDSSARRLLPFIGLAIMCVTFTIYLVSPGRPAAAGVCPTCPPTTYEGEDDAGVAGDTSWDDDMEGDPEWLRVSAPVYSPPATALPPGSMIMIPPDGNGTVVINSTDHVVVAQLIQAGFRLPPGSMHGYNEDRYIDRLRRARSGSPEQVEEWKRLKEAKLRAWSSRTGPGTTNQCRKPVKAPTKYYLTVCAVFKNEGSYIEEWLDYHLCAGVEHFYLFDHRSIDNSVDVVEPYVRAGLADLSAVDTQHNPQMALYTRCIRNFRDESTWMAFIDTDEFMVPIEQKCLPKLLTEFERFPGVLVCWVLFGSNGHIFQSPDWVLTSHPGHGAHASKRYKTIAQPARVKAASRQTPHAMIYLPGEMPVNERKVSMLPRQSSIRGRPSADILRLNHYRTKSMQEWVYKADRCHTSKSSEQQCLSRLAHWPEFDQNEIKDTSTVERILPCLRTLHQPMPSLAHMAALAAGRDDGANDDAEDLTRMPDGSLRPPMAIARGAGDDPE